MAFIVIAGARVVTWKNAIAAVATVAPTLASALGGPLAGTAVAALSKALGIAPEALPEAVLRATPEQLIEIKKAEIQFQTDMAALDVDLERIAAGDRESARKREVDRRDWVPALLGAAITLGFFGSLAAMLFFSPPDGAKEALYIMLGYLGGMASSVVTYYFGSSAGSARKNQLLAGVSK